jgi:hypothetical protein
MSELRTTAQRKTDVLSTLGANGHGWLATAGEGGQPRLIAVAVLWEGTHLVITTQGSSPTASNLDASGHSRLALGTPDDAILVDAEVADTVPAREAPDSLGSRWREAMGWDPADEGNDWRYFQLRPVRIEAYRGYGELEGRVVMRDGDWLA